VPLEASVGMASDRYRKGSYLNVAASSLWKPTIAQSKFGLYDDITRKHEMAEKQAGVTARTGAAVPALERILLTRRGG
jgi:hypothetical protein